MVSLFRPHRGVTSRRSTRQREKVSQKSHGGLAGKVRGSTIEVPGRFFNYTQVEPLGVCGAIIPWNYPLLMAARRSVPGIFMNAGQMCVAGSRLLVQDTAYDEYMNKLSTQREK